MIEETEIPAVLALPLGIVRCEEDCSINSISFHIRHSMSVPHVFANDPDTSHCGHSARHL